MKLSPLKDYRGPEYPTQEILKAHPELLRVLPRRWHNNPLVLGTLVGLLALMEQSTAKADDKPTLRVAPIFEHGEGQGAFGCVAIAPPVFLTEAEAREVIEDEAKKAGVEFTKRGHQLKQIPVPFLENFVVLEDRIPEVITTSTNSNGESGQTFTVRWKSSDELAKAYRKQSPVQTKEVSRDVDVDLTGWSPQKQIGYRFVSHENFEARGSLKLEHYEKLPDGTLKNIPSGIGYGSSGSHYDVRGAAQRLERGLEKAKDSGTVGVFYDPFVSPSNPPSFPKLPAAKPQNGKEFSKEEKQAQAEAQTKAWQEYEKDYDTAAKQESAEQLRLQVRDFLAWLKAQGVI